MTNNKQIVAILRDTGALQEGHFILTSGRHTGQYLQSTRIFRHPDLGARLCMPLAQAFAEDEIELVLGCSQGAVQMAYELSRQLRCENIFAERENGALTLRRGFSVQPGQRILVAEDVVTTGGSVREVIKLVRQAGAAVAGVAAIVDRSAGRAAFDVPFFAAATLDLRAWSPDECPICREKEGDPV